MQREVEHKSRTALACERLRERIVNAEFAPGEKLKIDVLSKSLEVSPGAVREALSRLTAEGLVIAEPQKGFVVAPISRQDLIELTEVRIMIEGLCLTRSIAQGNVEWESRVLALQHRLRALDGAVAEPATERAHQWHRLHNQFHDELASRCGNRWWLRLRTQLYLQSERYRRLSGPADETGRDITAEHDEIANAAIARDADRALEALTMHLRRTTEILLTSSLPFRNDSLD